MNKIGQTIGLVTLLVGSSLFLASCGEKEPEKSPTQIQFEANVASVPERSEAVTAMIQSAIGEPLVDNEGIATGAYENTLSNGQYHQVTLSTLTHEQLKELDRLDQIEIYLNGVVRDELYVPANILYGVETVQAHKQAFKEALMKPNPESDGHIVDTIVLSSQMGNPDVANHYVDDVITHLNRVYVKPTIVEDFESRLVISGNTHGLKLKSTLNSIEKNAREFVQLEGASRFDLTDQDKEKLTTHYRESFLDALTLSTNNESPASETLGGFEKNEAGVWVPSDMTRFATAFLRLSYLH